MQDFVTDILLPFGYVLLILGVVVALGFAILTVVSDFKGAMKSIIGTGLLLVIFLICYASASDEVLPSYLKYGVDSGTSKLIGAFIGTATTLLITGLAAGFIGSIYTMIKK